MLSMEIIFGIVVLVLIILGLRNRKKEKSSWIKEERYEESGAWIDKRSGERGAYGSLDEEMEANRLFIAKQSKINELTVNIQAFCFAQIPDFHKLSEESLQKHRAFCKSEITGLFEQIDQLTTGRQANVADASYPANEFRAGLKKQVLDFSFDRFPKLLDLEIEAIKKFDLATEQLSERVLGEIVRLRG